MVGDLIASRNWRATLLRLTRHPLLWIVLVALGVRLYNVTYHSLWFDEAVSTVWAARPAAEIWRVGLALTQDKHPPLYYLMLKGWTVLWGASDIAVRSLGALIGAVAVLPVYGIGRRLGGRPTGLLAGLLLALNPFLVWYSQEARMFMPATTFGLVGLYGVLLIADGKWQIANGKWQIANGKWPIANGIRYRPSAIGYPLLVVAGFTAALYTYFYSAFLVPVAGAWLLWFWWLNRDQPGAGRRFWLGVGVLGIVALLFLPLARSAWTVSGAEAVPGKAFSGMGQPLWRLLQVYTVGWPRWPEPALTWIASGAGLLGLIGILAPAREAASPPSLVGKGAGGLGPSPRSRHACASDPGHTNGYRRRRSGPARPASHPPRPPCRGRSHLRSHPGRGWSSRALHLAS